jgi:putative transposase
MLSRLILCGERALQHALTEYTTHYHAERPHQGKGNVILMSTAHPSQSHHDRVRCHERLGGLLKYHHRDAA